MSRKLLFAAVLLAGSVHAQTIIVKCVDAKGNITYTTDACEPGQSVKDVKSYAPVHDDPAARQRLRDIERIQAARDARVRLQGGGPAYRGPSPLTARDLKRAKCEDARKLARDARGKGYNGSYLIALDRAAADACFGL